MLSVASTHTEPKSSAIIAATGEKSGLASRVGVASRRGVGTALTGARSGRAALAACLLGGSLSGADPADDCRRADGARVAVAGGSITEIIYSLGGEDRIVAVDSTSSFPAAARGLPSVGYVRALSAEGLLSLDPTLVLGEDDMGPPEAVAMVERAGVALVRVDEVHTARGIIDKVRCVGSVLGLDDRSAALIATELLPVAQALDRLRGEVARKPRVAFLLQFRDGAPIGAGRGTSAQGLLDMAVADNVLADFKGWKPVSMEAMSQAAPDFVVITERGVRGAGGAAKVRSHPALALVLGNADRNRDRLIVMDGMALLGFGPRTLDSALALARRFHGASAALRATASGP